MAAANQEQQPQLIEPLAPSEFLDSVILLLASRHGADTNIDDGVLAAAAAATRGNKGAAAPAAVSAVDAAQGRRWVEVARDMQALAKSPSCRSGDLRIASPMVDDGEAFSPQACLHRARFALYRLGKEAQRAKAERAERRMQQRSASTLSNKYADPRDPRPSGFDVTKGHSVADAMKQIMEDARRRIAAMPSALSSAGAGGKKLLTNGGGAAAAAHDEDEDEDDDDGEPVALFQPPAGYRLQTEEEALRAMEAGAAEEQLMSRVHELQLDHFRKHRRWVNFGTGESTATPPASVAQQQQQQHQVGSPASSASQRPAVEDMTADDVAELLGSLQLGEHVGRFRRTTGPLLATMNKDDIRIRFDGDDEAADLVWHHLETKMQRRRSAVITNTRAAASATASGPATGAPRRLVDSLPASSAAATGAAPKRTTAAANAALAGDRGAAAQRGGAGQPTGMRAIYDQYSAPGAELAASTRDLDAFEEQHVHGGGEGAQSDLRNQLRAGSFQALKRTLELLERGGDGTQAGDEYLVSVYQEQRKLEEQRQPAATRRPPRPSEMRKNGDGDDEDDDGALTSEQDLVAGALMGGRHDSKSEQLDARQILHESAGYSRGGRGGAVGGRGGRGGAATSPAASKQEHRPAAAAAAAAAASSSSSARGGRWAVVEYSDNDDVE